MRVIWDETKNRKLMVESGISLDEFAGLILEQKYTAILKNPSREGQMIFVVPHRGYTYVVPFVLDENENIALKTAFPGRKYHKLYGGKKNEG